MVTTPRKSGFLHARILDARLFYEGARLSYIALFRWLHPPVYIASKIIMPLTQILFFTFLGIYAKGRDSADFYIVGNTMQMAALAGIYGVTLSIGGDRWEGTLPYLFGVPSSRLVLYLGRAFFHILDGIFGVIMALVMAFLVLGLNLSDTNFLALGFVILIATISTSAMGLMLGSISLVTVNVWFFNNVIYFVLLLFSGANIPRSEMPAWMVTVGDFLPLTRGVTGARDAIAGASVGDVAGLMAVEFLIGLIYGAIGFSIFRWVEFQARRRGSLDGV